MEQAGIYLRTTKGGLLLPVLAHLVYYQFVLFVDAAVLLAFGRTQVTDFGGDCIVKSVKQVADSIHLGRTEMLIR